MKSKKQPALVCPIDAIGVSACPMVAFSGFCENHKPPPSGNVRGIVLPHRHGHQNGQQSGYMLHRRFVCCRPGGRRGNTEQVVAQWQRPVTSGKPWSCCIGRCALYGTGAPPWPSKWPATEVHLFAAAAYFDCCNRS